MANRYLIVSDLHLADVEDHPNGWKLYKRSLFLFDRELDALVQSFVAEGGGAGRAADNLTLILNGDIFDFDLVSAVPPDPPWPVSWAERRRGLDATEAKSVWKLTRMLEAHPQFISTLADFLARGHRVVYVLGNHDRELHFPAVQAALVSAIEAQARRTGKSVVQGRMTFEPWFYYVPGEIYAEHGQQYDYYTSYRYIFWPVVRRGNEEIIALPMGNISNRYLLTKMGYFNPHAGDFILNIFSYLAHWLRYYAFTRRTLAIPWFFGSILVIGKLLMLKRDLVKVPPQHAEREDQAARRFGLTRAAILALGGLQTPPITQKLYRIIREFWLDRVAIAGVMIGGTIALALVPIPLWIKLMVPLSSFPLLFFIYEWAARGATIFTIEEELPKHARAIARLLPVKVVTFGHTHCPRMIPLSLETTFVDTGTWAPITCKDDPKRLQPGLRNYLTVSFEGEAPQLRFGSYLSDPERAQGEPPVVTPASACNDTDHAA